VILQGSGSISLGLGMVNSNACGFAIVPKFSDRRNGDGDVEELVRLGILGV
jgi:hypothetical protein